MFDQYRLTINGDGVVAVPVDHHRLLIITVPVDHHRLTINVGGGAREWNVRNLVLGLGFGFWVSGFWFRVLGFGVWVSGFGLRISGFRYRARFWGIGVWGVGFEV